MSDYKKQVRIKLIERDMNMVDLARELEITPSYLSELLNGTRKWPRYTATSATTSR